MMSIWKEATDRKREVRRTGRQWALLAALLALSAFGVEQARAQEPLPLTPEQTQTANQAMAQLRSPVTPSHTVDMCPSVGPLRDSIRVAAASGWTTEQIVEDVIARHGEQVRLLPKRRGAGLWAWIATPLVLLIGVGLIVARLRSDQQKAPQASAGSSLSETDRERLAAAMREWERDGGGEP